VVIFFFCAFNTSRVRRPEEIKIFNHGWARMGTDKTANQIGMLFPTRIVPAISA
jgi:hypothetical protein